MTGREAYCRAIELKSPPYVPALLWCPFEALYEKDEAKASRIRALEARFPDDLLKLDPAPKPRENPATLDGVMRWVDHWGTGWVDDGLGGKTESHPLEEGYHRVASHRFPDPHEPGAYDKADELLAHRDGRYVLGSVWFTLFERLWMLRGFDNMLLDPYTDEENFIALRDRVVEFALGSIDEWVKRGVDAVYFSDDWGGQHGLLMNPEDWRRWYKPAYARLFRRVREGGAHVWMHLCGDIRLILSDLIEIGLNVLNPVQPQAMDVHELARDFGGKVCFHGGVDVQGVLVNGKPDEVRAHALELAELFGRYNGGYILGTSHGIMPETPLDNIIALYEVAAELGTAK